jgi:transposase
MNTPTLYAALDLHSNTSVLGVLGPEGTHGKPLRFPTNAEELVRHVEALGREGVRLTLEASPLARWAVKLLRPHVEQIIVCEPRFNKLIGQNPHKRDENDVRSLCTLLSLGHLKEVWMGTERRREILRHVVGELLESRDKCREAKAHIKSRFRQWGVIQLHGKALFHPAHRQQWISRLEGAEEQRMMRRLYQRHEHALAEHKACLKEALRVARGFPEIARMRQVPGVGPVGAMVFCALIEEPTRFRCRAKLWRYCALGITDRSSDNKPLGYRRIDRRGNNELKNLSYHAWRTACKSTTSENPVKAFYRASLERTGSIRHARLNTQRKILETLWLMWLRGRPFDPKAFFLQTPTSGRASPAAESVKAMMTP